MRVGVTSVSSLVAVAAAAILLVGDPALPHAQTVAPMNAKQVLAAGGAVPANAVAEFQALQQARVLVPRARFATGRVVVKMAEGASEASLLSAASRAGASAVTHPAYADFSVVHLSSGQDVEAAAAAMATAPGVVYAEPDAIVRLLYVPNDPLYKYQWNLQKLDMERTWDINPGAASSLTVAIVDSGVAYLDQGSFRQAPDLAGVNFVSPHDFIWDDDQPFDLDGHGTHVTGTVAERTGNDTGVAGMAYNVSIMPVKVASTEWDEILGAPNVGTETIVAEGIRYAADNGAKVINLSLGFDSPVTAVRDAITYAIGKGAVVTVAAGNSGEQGNTPSYPAAYASDIEGLIAVAALDLNLNRAYYSNSNDYVEVAAPGGDLRADLNNDDYADGVLQQTLDPDVVDMGVFNQFAYIFASGTSMATPHVTGLAALLMTQGVTTPVAVEKVIERFATDTGAPGRDNDTGFGVINPRATIRGLGLSN